MRLLLDENLPKRLKADFADHEIYTVRDKGWNGIKNGQLLQLMVDNGFHPLLTFDKNLQHQQNFQKYTLAVLVLSALNNTYLELTKLSSEVHMHLNKETFPAEQRLWADGMLMRHLHKALSVACHLNGTFPLHIVWEHISATLQEKGYNLCIQ
jgi:hypothetical protein